MFGRLSGCRATALSVTGALALAGCSAYDFEARTIDIGPSHADAFLRYNSFAQPSVGTRRVHDADRPRTFPKARPARATSGANTTSRFTAADAKPVAASATPPVRRDPEPVTVPREPVLSRAAPPAEVRPPSAGRGSQHDRPAAEEEQARKATDEIVAALVPGGDAAAPRAANGAMDAVRQQVASGQVSNARVALLGLLPILKGEALLELARTYDPYYLQRIDKPDVTPDAQRAQALYEQAARLDAKDAAADLLRLRHSRP